MLKLLAKSKKGWGQLMMFFEVGSKSDHDLVKMGGTIATDKDGCISGGGKLPPADSSQYTLEHLAYMATTTMAHGQDADGHVVGRPLVFQTGTDTMSSVAYFLALTQPVQPVGLLGSMYHTDHADFDGATNEALLLARFTGDKRAGVVCAVDSRVYAGATFQKQRNDLKSPAFGDPVSFNRDSISCPETYQKALDVHKASIQLGLEKTPPESVNMPPVSVVGVTETTTPADLKEFLNKILIKEFSFEGVVVYGPLTMELMAVCEDFLPLFSEEGISLVGVHTGDQPVTSTELPMLSHRGETSDRMQVKLSWLLSVSASNKHTQSEQDDFLRELFGQGLVGEYGPGTESYYVPQRTPEMAEVETPLYLPRQMGLDPSLVRAYAQLPGSIVLGAFVDNLNGSSSLTPQQIREQLFEEDQKSPLQLEDDFFEGGRSPGLDSLSSVGSSDSGFCLGPSDSVSDDRVLEQSPILSVLKECKKSHDIILVGSTATRPDPKGFGYAPMQMASLLGITSV